MYQVNKIRVSIKLYCLVVCIFMMTNASADYDDEEALIELYGDEETISIATGTAQPISRAPAVASVITAQDIKEIGATDIDEALETVPGLHVSRSNVNNPLYTFRGIHTGTNPQVLMLINGIPITNLFAGDRNQIWGGMPVESISRIEVIRGPGSAVYGADAFAGVINIITKTASEIDGVEFGSRLGKFDSRDVWALYGKKLGNFDIALMAEWGETDGHDEDVNSDFASGLGFGSSLAPDSVNNEAENIDIRLDVSTGNWQLRAGLQNRDDVGLSAGIADALTPSTYESERWNADLTYHNKEIVNWDVKGQVSYFDTSQESDELQIFPPGTFGLPDGLISTPQIWERHHRYNVTALFSGFNKHSIRTGIGYTHSEIYKIEEEKNLGAGVAIPGVLTDVTDTPFAFLPEKHRNNSFVFLQDVWQISNDWELTAGLRYDDYNDFGDTWNPRAALVWAARHDLTAKLLYGQAFRAPSFGEFRNQNNPINLGNSELDPEEIKTLELVFDYRPKDNLQLGLNLFRYEWDDIIRLVPDGGGSNTAQNGGEQEGYGFEFEFDWKVRRTLNVLGNFAHQDSEDQTTREDAGNAPENQFYVRTDWEFLPGWHVSPQWNFVLDRKRPPGDTRSDIDDYDMLDLTLRHKSYNGRWEFALSGRNVLNKRAFEPASTSIPGDLPLARRAYFGELRFNY
jgi:iron complex outermembrane receptor protein